ncbi:MAG: DUF2721 domain-containing protein [Gammaproteobacteria bacterium]|jgi:hypothetical protein|nr:DUF2721 domain-containing protein [Gammaproteobacteria bacterium]
MDITTPALVFPAISLLFIAYTNRLHSLSVLIRSMTREDSNEAPSKQTKEQLIILQKRVNYIKRMQVLGIISFILCLSTIICLYIEQDIIANYVFSLALLTLVSSLLFALFETLQSTRALNIHLNSSNYK